MENIISTGFGITLGVFFVIMAVLTASLEYVWREHGSTQNMVHKLRRVYYGVSSIIVVTILTSALMYYL